MERNDDFLIGPIRTIFIIDFVGVRRVMVTKRVRNCSQKIDNESPSLYATRVNRNDRFHKADDY